MKLAVYKRRAMSLEWSYIICTIAAFVFTPELRRLADWHGNFDPLNTFAVIPLVMLCPVAFLVFRRRNKLRSGGFAFVAFAWFAAFAYAAFIATAHGAIVQALYSAAQFCLPVTIGAWLVTCTETLEVAHARLARALLVFGTLAGAYGIIQFVFAPPWDTAWMLNIGAVAVGTPERFGIRVFGVLNGPGIFALFLGSVILFNLPYLRLRDWLNMIELTVMFVALTLTLVRSAWLAVILGIIIFVCLSPRRLEAIASITFVAMLCCIGFFGVLVTLPDPGVADRIIERFTTFSSLQTDGSAVARQQSSDMALQAALDQPAGAGLGITGSGGKLGDPDTQVLSNLPPGPIDNGFLSRFFEMGVLGFATFLFACVSASIFLGAAYARFKLQGNQAAMVVTASCIATQVVIFMVNLAGDGQQALLGALFFAALAIPLMSSAKNDLSAPAHSVSGRKVGGFLVPRRRAFR